MSTTIDIQRFKRVRSGFTLIELVVAVAIVMIVAAGAVPVVRKFQSTTELKNAAMELQAVLRDAQNRSFSGEIACPSTQSLYGWAVELNVAGTTYRLHQVCYTPDGEPIAYGATLMKTVTNPESVSIPAINLGSNLFVIFRPAGRGIEFASAIASNGVTRYTAFTALVSLLSTSNNRSTVTIHASGEVDVEF